jgi:hypothetical protein
LSLYYHFYVETRGPEEWRVPTDFKTEIWTYDPRFGEFAWARPWRGWPELFFGASPLFPMRLGPPDDRRGSPLLRHLDEYYDYSRNEECLCWLPYAELFADCWDTDFVTVESSVPARYALLFGDGQQRFPEEALLEAGASEKELEPLCYGRPTQMPVDSTFGRQRSRIAELPPYRSVEVTWRATIAEFIGEPHAGLFKGLTRYGPAEDLRILSRRG